VEEASRGDTNKQQHQQAKQNYYRQSICRNAQGRQEMTVVNHEISKTRCFDVKSVF
jgi:hypothetical protein